MAMEKNLEKGTKSLNVEIDGEVFGKFDSQRKQRGQVKKDAAEAAVKLWISLPKETQARLLDKSLSEEEFIEAIRWEAKKEANEISQEVIKSIIQSAARDAKEDSLNLLENT